METITVDAVQATPVFLDRDRTVAKTCELVAKAAAEGAKLIVFPEAFIPTYPDWVWRTTPWADGSWYERFLANTVEVPSPATEALGEAARSAGAWVAVGINELDRSSTTVYNSLLYLAPDGTVAGCHRKLMPTGGEKLVWGTGDGSTLGVHDTDFGRLGGLICWENYMPLARAALYAQGIDVYLAPTWDNSDVWVPTLRHIAKEGRIYVIGTNSCLRGSDVPAELTGRDAIYAGEDDWMSRGNAVIISPDGEVLAGPLTEQEGILYAEVDVDRARASRRQFDPVGHYARPDVFRLEVDTRPRPPVSFTT